MSQLVKVIFFVVTSVLFVSGQDFYGMAPGDLIQPVSPDYKINQVFSAKQSEAAQDDFVFSTTTYTFADLIVFSYFNGSKFFVIDASGTILDSVQLDEDQYHVFSPGSGVFSIEGNQSFTLLIGDPVTNSVMGYFAVDESGSPLSTRLNTYMPVNNYSGEHFILFAYNDGTEFQIKNLTDATSIAAGILNKGEHFQLDGYNNHFLGVHSSKPVSALSYTDQGYYIPASNGTFAGTEFYGFSGYVGFWSNGIIVTSYEDSTDFIAVNSTTGDTLFQGRLDEGMVTSINVTSDLYWELNSTGKVTVCNTPYAGWSSNYYYLTRQIDESGLGIGTNFYTPVIGGNINLFSYETENQVMIQDVATGDTVWTGILNAGEGYSYYSGKAVLHFTSQKNIAVISSYGGGYGADFMPLNFAIGLPDLAVSSKDIVFDPEKESYDSGELITVYATIHNYGYESADNVKVKFYDGHPSGGVAISALLNLGTINSKGSAQASTTWTIPEYAEYHDIYVAVDWGDHIIESNNSNNVAFRPIIPNNDLLPPLTTTVDAPNAVGFESDTLEYEEFTIRVNIFNSGSVDAENVMVKLNLPSYLMYSVPEDSVQALGYISPNSTVSYTWNVLIDHVTEENAFFYSIFVDADNAEAKLVEKMLVVKRPTAIEGNEIVQKLPDGFRLAANYPNPFNPLTTIEYELAENCAVDLSIYDLLGRKVANLVLANQAAGQHKVHWNAMDMTSGIYYYRLATSTGYSETRKLVLMK